MIKTGTFSQLSRSGIQLLSKFFLQQRILVSKIFLFASTFFFHSLLSAQTLSPTVISSAGAYDAAGGISLSSTVGQPSAIESVIVPSIILTQGFQQPEDDATVGIEVLNDQSLEITAYPNPVSDVLKIQYSHPLNRSAQAQVTDLLGNDAIEPFDIISNEVRSLNLSSLAAGIYFLNVKEDNHFVTIKIIKAQ
jgi:Secretion system C-terminal sorting domain